MLTVGQIVFSKQGRDMGKPFVVVAVDDEYCYLADGHTRCLDRPKKKKFKHLQPTNVVDHDIGLRLSEGTTPKLLDADLRKALVNCDNMVLKRGFKPCQKTML